MILWLASFPRSGNTFLRIMLDECFGLKSFSDSNDERDIGASEEFSNLVGHRHYDGDWEEFYAFATASPELVPIKTHHAPVDSAKAIYLLRDPRAALVSLYHYYKRYGLADHTLDDVILGATAFGLWDEHPKAWRPEGRPDTLFLRYEDVTSAPESAVAKVAAFIGAEPLKPAPSSFAELNNANPEFFRAGSNDKNRSELTAEQYALISFLYGGVMKRHGYADSDCADDGLVRRGVVQFANNVFKEKRALIRSVKLGGTGEDVFQTLSAKLDNFMESNAKLREQRKEARTRIRILQSECKAMQSELAAERGNGVRLETELAVERDNAARLDAARAHFEKRALKTEHVLAPRLKSILTFAPMRFAIAEWFGIKTGGGEPWRPMQLGAGSRHGLSSSWVEERSVDGLLEAVKVEAEQHKAAPAPCNVQNLGIAVFAHDRAEHLVNVLEALERQGATPLTHVFIDGDQGRPAKRGDIDLVHQCAERYDVKAIHRNNGNFGFRKMMLLAMKTMMSSYEKIIFLEDDCFPVSGAVDEFDRALSAVADNADIFSVYGHPFLFPREEAGSARFQGWGWATTSAKLKPVWEQLMDCYLMTEDDYLAFVERELTPEIEEAIDITPGRLPSDTLRQFFAWDETLCLLTAMGGMRHQRTKRRLIYNCGAGGKSSHFRNIEYFRKPPFNMVSVDEVWDHYSTPLRQETKA